MPAISLSQFIRTNMPAILDDWSEFAAQIPAAHALDLDMLRDHARGILCAIADDIEQPQTPDQQDVKSKGRAVRLPHETEAEMHGSARVIAGFDVNDAMSEYRALRASVLRLWQDTEAEACTPASDQMIRFNEAIDQALGESLARFSSDKERSTRLFDTLLSASADPSMILDLHARLTYANKAMGTLFGMAPAAMLGRRVTDLDGLSMLEFEQQVKLVVSTMMTRRGELVRGTRTGPMSYEYLLVPVFNEQHELEAVVGTARDITERKAGEELIRRRAHYDYLTKLPNRSLFRDRLEHEIKRSARNYLPLALLFIDLDGFKEVNDLLGHEAGDELLRQSAQRIGSRVRDSDTVSRIGGDEFTVLLTDIRMLSHVQIVAQHIIEELSRPFIIAHKEVVISGSIGIALYPQDAASATELMRHADQAMYVAKNSGRNRFSYFTADMRETAWARLKIIEELREALAKKQLAVYYQPIVALDDGRIVGAEALLRWHHPGTGLLPAKAFIDLAEEAGLIGDIDAWVVGEVLARAHEWHANGAPPLRININESSLGFIGKSMDGHWESLLAGLASVAPVVGLDISETVLLNDSPGARHKLAQLGMAGVPITVDDFGAGYASMTSLVRCQLACLKIDAHLVQDMDGGTHRAALAAAMIAMAHALGLQVVAEGVETPEQKSRLAALGCDQAQGFLFSEALESTAFAQLRAGAATPPGVSA